MDGLSSLLLHIQVLMYESTLAKRKPKAIGNYEMTKNFFYQKNGFIKNGNNIIH